MRYRIPRTTLRWLACALIGGSLSLVIARAGQNVPPQARSEVVGQTVTQLTDGKWLVAGGVGPDGPLRAIVLVELDNGGASSARQVATFNESRGWHSATVLPEGQVLFTGGTGQQGSIVGVAEMFDPESGVVRLVPWQGMPRAHHTATLLRDGRVLIAGGVVADQSSTRAVEIFEPATFEVRQLAGELLAGRRDHTATLLPSGVVKLDGGAGSEPHAAEIYNVSLQESRPVERRDPDEQMARLAFVAPSNGDTVPADVRVALQFTKALAVGSIQTAVINLRDEAGTEIRLRSVLAESGRLLFLTPEQPLVSGGQYRLTVDKLFDSDGVWASAVSLTFSVQDGDALTGEPQEDWIPELDRPWRSDRPASPWQSLAPLRAAPGVTALSGQILLLNGRPIAGITLKLGEKSAITDQTGRFLIIDLSPGQHTLTIDGRSASAPERTYGVFLAHTYVKESETTVLAYTIWMPKIDTAHAVQISSPLGADLIVRTPLIPGLELHLPRGSVIRDHEGRPARTISITPIPVDRPPFPLPTGVDTPVYFTIQPGGGFIDTPNTAWPSGARVVYPNLKGARAGTSFDFWNYDPEERGWHVYGQGKVNGGGGQVIPNPGAILYRFTGTMINDGSSSPPGTGPLDGGPEDADPVDLGTGLFVLEKADLYVPDVMPLSLTRTYRPNDSTIRPFGVGATHPYEMFLWSAQQYTEADLVLPDGGRIHYVRTSPGTGWIDAVFEHAVSPGPFYKSKIVWNGLGWNLTLKDGTVYVFGDQAPLQAIRDRHGNQITLTRPNGQTGRVTRVASSSSRFLEFTYTNNRITQVKDNLGRTVSYQYDASDRLWKVTDAAGGVTEYTYDTSHRMLTIKDARGITFLTNQYDTNGRVTLQTQADNTTYQLAYTLDGSNRVTQTDVTDPRGYVTRWNFNTSQYPTSRIEAYGTPSARTTTWTRDAATHRVTRMTDGLNRNTDYTYDALGNAASVTRLAGTADAVTTSYTYDSTFSQPLTVTDPLNHTTTFTRNSTGDVTTITDPLTHQTTFTYNAAGQPLTVTTTAGTTSFAYDVGDLVSITDPLSRVTTRFLDVVGRLVSVTNPLGHTTRYEYDPLNVITKVTDTLGGQTTFTYDANRNLLTFTDARNNTTTYTYNNMDRVATRVDPLTRQESYTYDNNGNLSQITDRKSQVTAFTYDPVNRQTQATYHDSSTTAYTYDAGDRLTQVVDSIAGTITRGYDLLNRLTSETTPEGTIGYTYNLADRRATMTVAGQTQVSYSYDNADRLTSITQGSSSVAFAYDTADRRTVLTLPNGMTIESAYDAASQVTGLTYKLGANTLGSLTYTYDVAGIRATVGGTWARTGLPAAVASATYNAANQIATWEGVSFSYDNNGNLTNDGSKTYAWNVRNQLTTLSGGASASFQYDGVGRRRAKTISGTTIGFLYDGLNAVQELSGGSPSANILTGLQLDEWFMRSEGANTRNLLTDVLGSTVALADGIGAVQTEYTYEAFGTTTTTGGSSTNRFGFTGREDDGSNLYYYRARFYDTTRQRFLSEDPLDRFSGEPSLYTYVGNSPANWIDPYGLQKTKPPGPPPIPLPPGRSGKPNSWKEVPGSGGRQKYSPSERIPSEKGGQPSSSWDEQGHWDYDDGQGSPRKHYDPQGNEIPNPHEPPTPPKPPPGGGWGGVPWRLPFPFPVIINPCLINPFLPGCNPLPGRGCGGTT